MKINFTKTLFFGLFLFGLQISYSQEVLWGNLPGQGDFDGGLNDWTVVPESDTTVFSWSPDGDVGNGAFAAAGTAIMSPTAANGSMVLNGDFLISGGDAGNIPNPVPIIVTHLVSPVIHIDTISGTPLSVQWSQLIRRFVVDPGIFYSSFSVTTDGGMNWSEPVDCNPTLEAATANNPIGALNSTESVGIPFTLTEGKDSMQVRFTYNGDFYFWVIDDVQIVGLEANNMRVNEFIAIAPNIVTPVSQVHGWGFLADIENIGAQAQTNVQLTAKVFDPSNAEIYSEINEYGTIDADSLAENKAFAGTFTPPAIMGDYTATYTVSADSMDFDESNNSQSFGFTIGDTTFAKETGIVFSTRPADGSDGWAGGVAHSWAYGNYYYVANGEGWEAAKVSFGIDLGDETNAAAITGTSLIVWLYEWQDMDGDGNSQEEERTAVGFQSYEILGNEMGDQFITLPMDNFAVPGDPVPLKDDTEYIVMLTFASPGDDINLDIAMSGDYDYGGMNLRSDSVGVSRYAGFLGIGDETEFSGVGFGFNFVPAVRLHITEEIIVGTTELLDEVNRIEVYPNPIDQFLNVNYNFVETIDEVEFKVLDIDGRKLLTQAIDNPQNGNLQFEVGHLASGSYILQANTAEGVRSTKVLIQR